MVPLRARQSLWERLNGFAAPARGISMLLKNGNRSRATFQQDARWFPPAVEFHPDTGGSSPIRSGVQTFGGFREPARCATSRNIHRTRVMHGARHARLGDLDYIRYGYKVPAWANPHPSYR
jgi:hypothetical protein